MGQARATWAKETIVLPLTQQSKGVEAKQEPEWVLNTGMGQLCHAEGSQHWI